MGDGCWSVFDSQHVVAGRAFEIGIVRADALMVQNKATKGRVSAEGEPSREHPSHRAESLSPPGSSPGSSKAHGGV